MPTDLIWRLSVAQYHEMIRTGILTDDDPVELLEGCLVFKMPKNPAHRVATTLIRQALEKVVPTGWYVESQEPITLEDSEPEPDVVILKGEPRDYQERHPGPDEVALVVEVSDTTLARDQGIKKQLYARAGILVYWIVNLVDRQVEVFRNPSKGAGFQASDIIQAGEQVPVEISGQRIALLEVLDLLP